MTVTSVTAFALRSPSFSPARTRYMFRTVEPPPMEHTLRARARVNRRVYIISLHSPDKLNSGEAVSSAFKKEGMRAWGYQQPA